MNPSTKLSHGHAKNSGLADPDVAFSNLPSPGSVCSICHGKRWESLGCASELRWLFMVLALKMGDALQWWCGKWLIIYDMIYIYNKLYIYIYSKPQKKYKKVGNLEIMKNTYSIPFWKHSSIFLGGYYSSLDDPGCGAIGLQISICWLFCPEKIQLLLKPAQIT